MKKTVATSLLAYTLCFGAEGEILSSWNSGESKNQIIEYVESVTDHKSKDFIQVQDRIVVFDNDGTLWSEQPLYFQLLFALDRVKALASKHPEWRTTEPFKSVLENNIEGILKGGKEGLLKIINISHAGVDVETFQNGVRAWLKEAKHPTKNRHYSELVYQPMMELIDYLKENDFKVYIVSGGGIDFMRTFIPEIYGIPVEHIIGTKGKVHYEKGKIVKDEGVDFIDDQELKPVAIYQNIGKRPVAAFGNSDGDFAMMLYTEAHPKYRTLQLYLHHTDSKREWAYDKISYTGVLDKGLTYAKEHNWTVVDMKKEWKVVYPFELK